MIIDMTLTTHSTKAPLKGTDLITVPRGGYREYVLDCECGMKHTFLLPLPDKKDENIECTCGRYVCTLLRNGDMIVFSRRGER